MQVELHRHLDVSTRPETLLELAQDRGLEGQSTSLSSFKQRLLIKSPLTDLRSVLSRFTLFQKVLDRPETLERIAFEAVEDCWNEGTRKVEFRYCPDFVSEYSHLNWEDSLNAFYTGMTRGLQRHSEMSAGLICIASRDYGQEAVDSTVEFFLSHRDKLIGLDLAGNEAEYPCRLFERSFKKAVQAGAKITVHAGEATGPENIWEALELLGARRIGHGVTSVQDPKLMQYLAQKEIALEMCPTSNWITQIVKTLPEHPLPLLLRSGVPVTINTDDPGIFGITLSQEIQICREKLQMTEAEIAKCQEHAQKQSFVV